MTSSYAYSSVKRWAGVLPGAEVLAGGVEQDGQVLAADPASVGAPGLADGGVELLAVGTGLDLGGPAA